MQMPMQMGDAHQQYVQNNEMMGNNLPNPYARN